VAGAIVDLETGNVPATIGAKGSGWQHWMFSGGTFPAIHRVSPDSRLLIVRQAAGQPSIADTYYFVLGEQSFQADLCGAWKEK
jgi:hypothetical protein